MKPRAVVALMVTGVSVVALGWDLHRSRPADEVTQRVYQQGIDHYRRGDLAAALDDFRSAAAASGGAARQAALYNLGTTQLRLAILPRDKDREVLAAHLAAAVRNLGTAVVMDPDDADAVHNLSIARKRLAALREGSAASPKTSTDPVARGSKPLPAAVGEPLPASSSRPTVATDLAREGVRRRTPLTTRDQALRLLDEERGRERLSSVMLAKGDYARGSMPEKDW